jgi:hypothetical protein
VPAAPAPAQASAAAAPTDEEDEASQKKDEGPKKWSVDTSYIDYRTADPNRLEPRRSVNEDSGAEKPTPAVAPSSKDKDGSWKQVDVGYINHRTAQVENLEGRKTQQTTTTSAAEPGAGAGVPASATVKKDTDGKWKVDTTYIGYRTGDTNNLIRKEEKNSDSQNYSDPAEKKYSYEELKGTRPPDVDPRQKEQYLSEDEFKVVFGVTIAEFNGMAKWKQQNQKKAKDLF